MKKFNGNILDHIWLRGFDVLSSKVIKSSTASKHTALSATLSSRE